jgi:hypothetical protein
MNVMANKKWLLFCKRSTVGSVLIPSYEKMPMIGGGKEKWKMSGKPGPQSLWENGVWSEMTGVVVQPLQEGSVA